MKRVFAIPGKVHGNAPCKFQWQKKQGNYLATSGNTRAVNIFDRKGNHVTEVSVSGEVVGFDWSKDGDTLAIIHDKSNQVTMWDANTKEVSELDTGIKNQLSFVGWSKTGPQLCIGSAKGNMMIYNHRSARKVPVLGTHDKRIHAGAWSAENLLCLCSDDKCISLNKEDGQNVQKPEMHGDPSLVQFYDPEKGAVNTDPQISVVLNKQNLYLLNANDPERPIELSFQPKYGNIVNYSWFGDGKIMIGFTSGYLIVVSTDEQQIGQELYQNRDHKSRLNDIACSTALGKAASCGDNCVKIHDLQDFADIFAIITLDEERGMLDKIQWCDDGQLLTISTQSGKLFTYLTKLPVVGSACGSKVAYLTSLQEMTAVTIGEEEETRNKMKIPIEPSAVAVGPYHAACAMNNRAWFYILDENGGQAELVAEEPKTYLGSIKSMTLNSDYAAVLCDGKVQLHLIEGDQEGDEGKEEKLFPDKDENNITAVALTNNFFIYSTNSGGLHYFLLEDWQFVNEYRHVVAIKTIEADASGARLLFSDEKGDVFLYNPVNDAVLEVPSAPTNSKGMMWDQQAGNSVFIVYNDEVAVTYTYATTHINGPQVSKIATTDLPYGTVPLALLEGELTCLTQSGKTTPVTLASHSVIELAVCGKENYAKCLKQNVDLRRFREALIVATKLDDEKAWKLFAKATLEELDIDYAIHVHRAMGDAATVNALKSLQNVEDRNLLGGHIALILGDENKAQDMFLASSKPSEALNMHRDLLHWEQALQLASKLDKKQIPYIAREYAQQLEFTGQWSQALQYYQNGVTGLSSDRHHDQTCKCGQARMYLRSGEISKGLDVVNEMNHKQLYRDCAGILDSNGQLNDAADLYEKGGQPEKAAEIFIRSKNWKKVGELLQQTSSPRLHGQYAKALEASGSFAEAAKAYEAAKDYLSVIRINLDKLRNPDEAVRVVKQTQSVDGAKLVAQFFQNMDDYASAIQFLVMSKCSDEALTLAKKHDKMDIYAQVVGDSASGEDNAGIAAYFEGKKQFLEAGQFHSKAGNYEKALNYLLKCNNADGAHIDSAIDTVSAAKDDELTQRLIEYLMGETDGTPKEAKYLFKLYMALKKYPEAAKTAVVIAREEQISGNYRNAHDTLFGMYRQLREGDIPIPSEMRENLLLLHSYTLVKMHVKKGDHLKGAHMLTRVADSISKFPAHIVNILTSTVIECHRSGLKASAFSYAAMLMRPEYRTKIDAKYKKKIEAIVRRSEKADSETPTETPCPYCQTNLPCTTLQCHSCENILPYCIATGYHMVKDQWAECPDCRFPGNQADLAAVVDAEQTCPMCAASINSSQLIAVSDPSQQLRVFKNISTNKSSNAGGDEV